MSHFRICWEIRRPINTHLYRQVYKVRHLQKKTAVCFIPLLSSSGKDKNERIFVMFSWPIFSSLFIYGSSLCPLPLEKRCTNRAYLLLFIPMTREHIFCGAMFWLPLEVNVSNVMQNKIFLEMETIILGC